MCPCSVIGRGQGHNGREGGVCSGPRPRRVCGSSPSPLLLLHFLLIHTPLGPAVTAPRRKHTRTHAHTFFVLMTMMTGSPVCSTCVFQDARGQCDSSPSYLRGSDERGGDLLSIRPPTSIWGCCWKLHQCSHTGRIPISIPLANRPIVDGFLRLILSYRILPKA